MKIRGIDGNSIVSKTAELILKTNFELSSDVEAHLKKLSPCVEGQEKQILEIMRSNSKISREEKIPLCQDTGISIFIVEIGKIFIDDARTIQELLNESVKLAYGTKKLRPSILKDPLRGENSKNNTPAVVHIEMNASDKLVIKYLAKGGGSENAGAVKMMKPSDGIKGMERFVIKQVRDFGINACPPLIVGIGLGGTMEHCAYLSKKALFREIGNRNADRFYSQIEINLKERLNKTKIGMQGLGGENTVMDVFVEQHPRHMATFPVAVSILCHSARKGAIEL
jgi:fumarate hydratase subunit alpha